MALPFAARAGLRCRNIHPVAFICAIERSAVHCERQRLFFVAKRNASNMSSKQPETEANNSSEDPIVAWQPKEEKLLDSRSTIESLRKTEQSTDSLSVPWYLQVAPPVTHQDDSHPMAERQKLPELPAYPPPLLEPLMIYVSIDLGLDDLHLLDLRSLDPPPALGTNLLMLIGSARSEKHLHVSADRCCRWLRSTYKLSPFADGLLGRNELKLKQRRKARRARLMSTVGASSTADTDEGMRTGWVCVNVGQVEPSKDSPMFTEEVEGFVGFGQRNDGVSIVIQMFTEEKRAEVNLEGLWDAVLNRNLKQKPKMEEAITNSQNDTIDGNSEQSRKLAIEFGSSNSS